MLSEPVEYLPRRNTGTRISEGFFDALAQPVGDRGILPIKRPHCGSQNLALGCICA
jgi:hypothetical protein